MNTAKYLNFRYSQNDYILLKVGQTSGGELDLCWGCRKLIWQDYLDAGERMAERARTKREAVTVVPAFAVKRKAEKSGRWYGNGQAGRNQKKEKLTSHNCVSTNISASSTQAGGA